jgi:hypothetical protein
LRLLGLRTRDARDQAVVAGESVFRVRGRVTVPQASNENDEASVAEGSDAEAGWQYQPHRVEGQEP